MLRQYKVGRVLVVLQLDILGLGRYEKLKENKADEDAILFMDATHPQHNPVMSNGWIKQGKDFQICSNTGRQRLNINRAISLGALNLVMRYDDTINAESTIKLFEQIEDTYPNATRATTICDNAGYYRSKLLKAYPIDSRIELMFLSPYAPNLNLIERYWKYFKKNTLYNRHYETFKAFKQACTNFLPWKHRRASAVFAIIVNRELSDH